MNVSPFPVFPHATTTVPGTPKGVARDPATGSIWVLVQTPGPPTSVTMTVVGTDLPEGARYIGGMFSDGMLFIVTAGDGP